MEGILSTRKPSPEAELRNFEKLSREKTAYLGNLAIHKDELLGINDPLTHLCQYIERGDEALIGIKEDFETDVAERLPKTPFVNHVGFEFTGTDFVSVKDRVSMNSMTKSNLRVLQVEASHNPELASELSRAEVEAAEVSKLAAWFKTASINSYLIFESLPIGQQKIAVSRIYQKQSSNMLDGCFVSLYNPSISQFNDFRRVLNPGSSDCGSELEILKKNYEFHQPNLGVPTDFIDYYVETYDRLLNARDGGSYSFGLEANKKEKVNGLSKIRSQPRLSMIYTNAIKALAQGDGRTTSDIININEKLGLRYQLRVDQRISIDLARGFIGDIINGIVSVIDKADDEFLNELEGYELDSNCNYAAVSIYGAESRSSGETYTSNACPEFNRIDTSESANQSSAEQTAILRAFNIWENIDLFGHPRIDVCRTSNCPTHGKSGMFKDRTVVGGCGFCVSCHKILQNKNSPEKIYSEKIAKENMKNIAKSTKEKPGIISSANDNKKKRKCGY